MVDETAGFRYLDGRDLLGLVDGTAGPVRAALPASVLVAGSDALSTAGVNDNSDSSDTRSVAYPVAVCGTFFVVQKYVHGLGR